MNVEERERLGEVIDRDARTAIRCLAAAERATMEGRLNLAKVLRATALSARTRALTLERSAAAGAPSLEAFAAVHAAERASVAVLEGLAEDSTFEAGERMGLRGLAHRSVSLTGILDATAASLVLNRDVLESDVAQLLWGCEDCGYIAPASRADVCPACGSIAGDWTLFAPFYSATAEHILRRTPDEIVAMLEGDAAGLRAALGGASEEQLLRRATPEEWCAKEIAGHMVDVAELFCRRLRGYLEPDYAPPGERSILPWALIEGQDYPAKSGEEIAGRFDAVMGEALTLVARLRREDWRKKADWVLGRVSVIDLGSWLANHNVAHLQQVQATVEG